MTIIQIFSDFLRKNINFNALIRTNKSKIISFNPVIFLTLVISISIIFFSINSLITQRNIEKQNNIKTIAESNEFSKFTDFIVSKLNSPYSDKIYN